VIKSFLRLTFILVLCLALFVSTTGLRANPAGGNVAAGSASIAGQGTGAVTVNQTSNTAIINWQSFSIASGELTKFVQPSSTSAALNRVLGGQTSLINGTLSANGQIYLINGNGILVGPGGVINAGGFTGSTRDMADADFLKGNLHFAGSSQAGVQNLGSINALGGDVILIGQTVDNEGRITAANGTAGLVAANDVIITQSGDEHVFVSGSNTAASAAGKTGVNNSGTITATTAELKAANGNIYALAINNSGTIRATTVNKQGGRIFLVSDTGTVKNSGTLDASATVAGGKGGSIKLKTAGTAIHSGTILAKGGQGGAGGQAEISGQAGLSFTGKVDLTAPGGTTGTLLLDPADLTIQKGGSSTDPTASTIDPFLIDATLATANVTLDADNSITINSGISWSNDTTLTLQTGTSGSPITITINAAIYGPHGALAIDAGPGGGITTSDLGGVQVRNFTLVDGSWMQNSANLATFQVGNDFKIQGGSFSPGGRNDRWRRKHHHRRLRPAGHRHPEPVQLVCLGQQYRRERDAKLEFGKRLCADW